MNEDVKFLAALILDGFRVRAKENALRVSPADMLTDDITAMIKKHKPRLLFLLKQWHETPTADLISLVYDALATEYPGGAVEWVTKEKPELDKQWLDTLNAIDDAYKAMDPQAFIQSLAEHCRACRRIFAAYKESGEMAR